MGPAANRGGEAPHGCRPVGSRPPKPPPSPARDTGARLVFWPWRLWVRSVAGSCSMVCTFFAFAKLPAADVLTLTNTFPIWVAVLSWPLYGRPPGGKMLLAIGVGVLGVVLVE